MTSSIHITVTRGESGEWGALTSGLSCSIYINQEIATLSPTVNVRVSHRFSHLTSYREKNSYYVTNCILVVE